ncbi:MAG TPA: hypothetical protein VIX41_04085, partial [Acidimicrobiales bacterium]
DRITQMKEEGVGARRIARVYREQRAALIENLIPYAGNAEAAERLATKLGLIPPAKFTEFQSNVTEAGTEVDDYNAKIFGVPKRWLTRFINNALEEIPNVETLGLNSLGVPEIWPTNFVNNALTQTPIVRELDTTTEDVPTTWETTFPNDAPPRTVEVGALDTMIHGVPPNWGTLFPNDAPARTTEVNELETAVINIPEFATTTFSTPGLADANSAASAFEQRVNALDGRTVTINFRGLEDSGLQHGGQAGFGAFAGEAGAEFVRFPGVANRTLLSGPLPVPVGTTVTSAALTAAMIRSQGASGTTIARQINLVQNITPALADPTAVAVQVINRAAAMANV